MPIKIVDGVEIELTSDEVLAHTAMANEWAADLHNRIREDVRSKRKPILEEADFKINTLVDQGADASAWRTYRQALRDITNQVTADTTDISNVTWPTKPE